MKKKNVLTVVLTLTLALSLCACGKENEAENTSTEEVEDVSDKDETEESIDEDFEETFADDGLTDSTDDEESEIEESEQSVPEEYSDYQLSDDMKTMMGYQNENGEIVYAEWYSENEVWWALRNYLDNTHKVPQHHKCKTTENRFDLEWDRTAEHWKLTTTDKSGTATVKYYDDDLVYPIDYEDKYISQSDTSKDWSNFDTGNIYANIFLSDVLNLDNDDSKKNGETYSFLAKNAKQDNIYADLHYDNGHWNLYIHMDDGYYESGYYDENFIYHENE